MLKHWEKKDWEKYKRIEHVYGHDANIDTKVHEFVPILGFYDNGRIISLQFIRKKSLETKQFIRRENYQILFK